MGKAFIKEETLTDIGNAIRAKTGETAAMLPSAMAGAIANMKTGFPNGTKWENNGLELNFFAPFYFDGIWIAGDYQNGVYWSNNGKEWNISNLIGISNNDCNHANGLFVLAAHDNGLYYSGDGKTWTRSNITSGNFYRISFANGLWFAGSNDGLYYSPDGKSWTKSNISAVTVYRNVVYAHDLWVCGTWNGIYYSTNGRNWTQCYSESYCSTLHYYNGTWVCCRGSNLNNLLYSTDGINWHDNLSSLTGQANSVICVDGLWIAVFLSGHNGIWYSTDGKSWVQSNVTNKCYDVCYHNGLFIAVGDNCFYYSDDGKAWTKINATGSGEGIIRFGNGIWVCGELYSIAWEL